MGGTACFHGLHFPSSLVFHIHSYWILACCFWVTCAIYLFWLLNPSTSLWALPVQVAPPADLKFYLDSIKHINGYSERRPWQKPQKLHWKYLFRVFFPSNFLLTVSSPYLLSIHLIVHLKSYSQIYDGRITVLQLCLSSVLVSLNNTFPFSVSVNPRLQK